MRTSRVLAFSFAMALVATACGGSASETSSTGSPATEPTSGADQTTTTIAARTTTSPPTTSAPTTLPSTVVEDALLVANQDGAFLVDDEFLFQLVTGPVELAVDDGQGGLVFQRSSDAFASFPPDPTATIIDYLPPDSFEPRQLLVPTGEQYLELWDADDGVVWYSRREGDSPENSRETLRSYNQASAAVEEFAVTGGWESGSLSVSVAGSSVVVYWSSEAATGFVFYADSGAIVELEGDPYESTAFCGDGLVFDEASGVLLEELCYEFPELSEDGRLAYLERDAAGSQIRYILVVVDMGTGEELFRQDLDRPDQGWKPATIDLRADQALVNRTASGEWGAPFVSALLIDLNSGDVAEVGASGQARFLTGPMGIS